MFNEQLNVVIIGHVDHGKSSVIGRLLADTGSLAEGKLESVKETCRRNSKPFEYAFLLDALKDEQAQGITIDAARCFFNSKKRSYIILDAPGHIEFLKNMVTGAARAEAALIVIDANEGIQENTTRHGYLVSLLGVKQVVVLVNKMDLVNYDQKVFENIQKEYGDFLENVGVSAKAFVPMSARYGVNITEKSPEVPWYKGDSALGLLDSFEKLKIDTSRPFRFPVHAIYKFTANGDDRRIIAGRVESGSASVGDELIFLPSGKESRIKSIEMFNAKQTTKISEGEVRGFTMETQIYLKAGEVAVLKKEKKPFCGRRFIANICWLGRNPMVKNRRYKLKIGTASQMVQLVEIKSIIDASDLTTNAKKEQVDVNDIAVVTLETSKPIAFDLNKDIEVTGRFVIVDDFEIAGGGIILDAVESKDTALKSYVQQRDQQWDRGFITPKDRQLKFNQKPKFVVVTGCDQNSANNIAKTLEKELFNLGYSAYYLGISDIKGASDSSCVINQAGSDGYVRRVGELAKIFTDAGLIFITTLTDIDRYDMETIALLTSPSEAFIINQGNEAIDLEKVALKLDPQQDSKSAVKKICSLLSEKEIILEYYI